MIELIRSVVPPDILVGVAVTLFVVYLVRGSLFARWIPQPVAACPECVKKQAVIDQLLAELLNCHGEVKALGDDMRKLTDDLTEKHELLEVIRRGSADKLLR
jgi:hypothetical protein